MIYFVAGATCTGKTFASRLIANHLSLEVVSTDTIKDVLQFVEPNNKSLHTNSYRAWSDLGLSEGEVYKGAKAHSKSIWGALGYICEKFINRGDSVIIEGSHLLPEFFSLCEQLKDLSKIIVLAPSDDTHKKEPLNGTRKEYARQKNRVRLIVLRCGSTLGIYKMRLLMGFRTSKNWVFR